MTTHRTLQLGILLDKVQSMARICRIGSANLARIGNTVGSSHQLHRAQRFERIASTCERRLARSRQDYEKLTAARDIWLKLAKDEDSLADFWESKGLPYGSVETYRYRASRYRDTAKSIQIQIDTGVAVCACHFKPFGEGNRV